MCATGTFVEQMCEEIAFQIKKDNTEYLSLRVLASQTMNTIKVFS